MLRNGITAFPGEADERIGRCDVDDDSTANVTTAVPISPSLRPLLPHCCDLRTYINNVAVKRVETVQDIDLHLPHLEDLVPG